MSLGCSSMTRYTSLRSNKPHSLKNSAAFGSSGLSEMKLEGISGRLVAGGTKNCNVSAEGTNLNEEFRPKWNVESFWFGGEVIIAPVEMSDAIIKALFLPCGKSESRMHWFCAPELGCCIHPTPE